MTTARGVHTATLLPSGKVLVAGGSNGAVHLDSSELYIPATTSILFAPTVKISGKKQRYTKNNSLRIKGISSGLVTKITAQLGKKRGKRVTGTTNWKLIAKSLLLGRNKLTVTAYGPGGASVPAKITITRNP